MSIFICIFAVEIINKQQLTLTPKSRNGNKEMEFKKAVEEVNNAIATIKCGCKITSDEELYADNLYYKCREYIKTYDDANYILSTYRNK